MQIWCSTVVLAISQQSLIAPSNHQPLESCSVLTIMQITKFQNGERLKLFHLQILQATFLKDLLRQSTNTHVRLNANELSVNSKLSSPTQLQTLTYRLYRHHR